MSSPSASARSGRLHGALAFPQDIHDTHDTHETHETPIELAARCLPRRRRRASASPRRRRRRRRRAPARRPRCRRPRPRPRASSRRPPRPPAPVHGYLESLSPSPRLRDVSSDRFGDEIESSKVLEQRVYVGFPEKLSTVTRHDTRLTHSQTPTRIAKSIVCAPVERRRRSAPLARLAIAARAVAEPPQQRARMSAPPAARKSVCLPFSSATHARFLFLPRERERERKTPRWIRGTSLTVWRALEIARASSYECGALPFSGGRGQNESHALASFAQRPLS